MTQTVAINRCPSVYTPNIIVMPQYTHISQSANIVFIDLCIGSPDRMFLAAGGDLFVRGMVGNK